MVREAVGVLSNVAIALGDEALGNHWDNFPSFHRAGKPYALRLWQFDITACPIAFCIQFGTVDVFRNVLCNVASDTMRTVATTRFTYLPTWCPFGCNSSCWEAKLRLASATFILASCMAMPFNVCHVSREPLQRYPGFFLFKKAIKPPRPASRHLHISFITPKFLPINLTQ